MPNPQTPRAILTDTLIAPILKLKETHPDHWITEKGYERLLDQALSQLQLWIGSHIKIATLSGNRDKRLEMIGFNQALQTLIDEIKEDK